MAGGLFTGVFSGMIIACADTTIPPGWLVCDGTLQPVPSYPELFAAIGHAYNEGVDPGGDQFRLPNVAGRFVRGSAAGHLPGSYSGNAEHSHSFTPTLAVSDGGLSRVSDGAHNHGLPNAIGIVGGGDHGHATNFGATSVGGGVESAKQSGTLAWTAQHHTHPTPSATNTNNSGNHEHAGSGGTIVSGGGSHNHNAVTSNPQITTKVTSNDPKHNVVQYLIKT
jgi:hypothetical protein